MVGFAVHTYCGNFIVDTVLLYSMLVAVVAFNVHSHHVLQYISAIVNCVVFTALYCSSCDDSPYSSAITLFSIAVQYQHTTIVPHTFLLRPNPVHCTSLAHYHRQGALSHDLPARPGARRRGPENEQDHGQCDGPPGGKQRLFRTRSVVGAAF
jgi:hypothetical protein